RQQISRWLVQRNASQPVEYRSAGSIFKNPPGDYAGRLVEASGVKGSRIGGAMISEKHGNFFVNLGGARAADVLALIRLARERVRALTGIDLELEIRVVGED
ncbi:MAG TPA: UDP-N-acetylenolpyruvoylglucosamine reductase, partial [Candidatus Methylomirabilis sp.]|nr:UDP-N-acetylenolpyruvoylglucosamine reductase [Candidatus Methylomirabilis sp.]